MSRIIEGEIPKPYMEAVTRVGFRRLTIIAGTNHIGVRITQDQADEIVKAGGIQGVHVKLEVDDITTYSGWPIIVKKVISAEASKQAQ